MIRVRIRQRPLSVLDFDIEARATGYGDPNWVPQEVTAIAWSWLGDDWVECRLRCHGAKTMFRDFVKAYDQADMVVGHNIRKYDLPVLNADLLRHGLPPLTEKLTHDSLRDIVRTKGLKRDQDNLAKLHGLEEEKVSMSWQDWQDAYAEKGWPMVAERVVRDVEQHKAMRSVMYRKGWLKEGRVWRP